MNYSRAGGPTPVNKPGVDKRVDDKMEILLEQKHTLEEAITYYYNKVSLNDWWKDWYENALNSYKLKLVKVNQEICNTSGVSFSLVKSNEETSSKSSSGEDEKPSKKEVIKAEKS